MISFSTLQYIIARLNQLKCSRWKITLDTFTDTAPQPFGEKKFTNIIATLDPDVDKRLVLAAHYDSKYFSPIQGSFVGATDSAVPVALLLDLALTLDDKLCNRRVSLTNTHTHTHTHTHTQNKRMSLTNAHILKSSDSFKQLEVDVSQLLNCQVNFQLIATCSLKNQSFGWCLWVIFFRQNKIRVHKIFI